MATPIRICGVGSPFGDDQIGWQAVEALKRSKVLEVLPAGTAMTYLCDRPGPRLLEILKGAELGIIIDAMVSGATPGTLKCVQFDSLSMLESPYSTHGFDLASTLALGAALGELPHQLFIYGIEIEPPTVSLQNIAPNPTLAVAMPKLITNIENTLKVFCQRPFLKAQKG
ncbi:hydrogenase maturation protease [Nitrosococcus wardiae]|uniref:Hydrogenase maturation protease n=1 Tax=Nitrosococcus wardiae TaxID=1814290 RepID=A0A4V1AW58_9GAMM|nr:hydrogenase maturation protease [Nitrosococcus wardiae]QBQ55485.1 hydrogenase maturation protease [Nitrosococcus wardiae]